MEENNIPLSFSIADSDFTTKNMSFHIQLDALKKL